MHSIRLPMVAAVLLAGGWFSPASAVEDEELSGWPAEALATDDLIGETLETEAEARAEDAAAYTELFGVTQQEAVSRIGQQIRLDDAISDIKQTYGDLYAGAVVHNEAEPFYITLKFTEAPGQGVRDIIARYDINASVQGGSPSSERQLVSDLDALTDAMLDRFPGYEFVISADTESYIIAVHDRDGLTQERRSAALDDARRIAAPGMSVELLFESDSITGTEESLVRGGAWLYSKNYDENVCTSGFTVFDNGRYGVSTAGHCDNNLAYNPPRRLRFDIDFLGQHEGRWGDFQWHVTRGHGDTDTFYVRDTGLRTVKGVKEHFPKQGTVCKYCRTTGYGCETVLRPWPVIRDDLHEITYRRQVLMKKVITDIGDSGGPWFLGGQAAGIHHGWGFIKEETNRRGSAFSRIGAIENALGPGMHILCNGCR